MPAAHDTYTRRQGLKKTYDVEYTALRYQISLGGKILKHIQLPIQVLPLAGAEASWHFAISDIEHLRGMPEM
ncbi:hypothetical protein [Rugamonas sp.]|uniref:hypothetical protein n=1 Tax=Rugamonas sp. TaxID=1926287 RepID=UPI0025FC48B2|nr:hypothetical protein [Rugamonas sp.]